MASGDNENGKELTSRWGSRLHLGEGGANAILLVTLIFLLGVVPFLPGHNTESIVSRVTWSVLIVAAILGANGRRLLLWMALVIAIPTLASRWIGVAGMAEAGPLLIALFFALISAHLLADIFSANEIRLNQVLGGVNVYLLLGVLFAQLHIAIERFNAGSYMLGDLSLVEAAARAGQQLEDMLQYFSFTTITTLGYGDIRPVSHAAQVLSTFEAVLGQLFIAILIARLVSVYMRPLASVADEPKA